MNQKDKWKQMNKEAKASGLALLTIIIFWILAGFGVAQLHITLAHTPLWVITGCLGTWIFAVLLVAWMMKYVFKDFELDDDEESSNRTPDEEVKSDEQ